MATYALGPANGSLQVFTTRQGVAAKVGHDLTIEVEKWQATLETGDTPSIDLEADSTTLQIVHGTGGVKALTDKDRGEIRKNIDAKILRKQPIRFRGSNQGELELAGTTKPCTIRLEIGDDGAFTGSTTIKQTDWGIKPYSGLMGALKVADEVTITVSGRLPG